MLRNDQATVQSDIIRLLKLAPRKIPLLIPPLTLFTHQILISFIIDLHVLLVEKLVINPLTSEKTHLENGFGDQKMLAQIPKNPRTFGYLKETNLSILQEHIRKVYKRIMWVIDSG